MRPVILHPNTLAEAGLDWRDDEDLDGWNGGGGGCYSRLPTHPAERDEWGTQNTATATHPFAMRLRKDGPPATRRFVRAKENGGRDGRHSFAMKREG